MPPGEHQDHRRARGEAGLCDVAPPSPHAFPVGFRVSFYAVFDRVVNDGESRGPAGHAGADARGEDSALATLEPPALFRGRAVLDVDAQLRRVPLDQVPDRLAVTLGQLFAVRGDDDREIRVADQRPDGEDLRHAGGFALLGRHRNDEPPAGLVDQADKLGVDEVERRCLVGTRVERLRQRTRRRVLVGEGANVVLRD